MEAEVIRKIHLNVQSQILSLQSKLSDINMNRTAIIKKLEELQTIQMECSSVICKACNGYGEIRTFYAQDESRFEVCEKCKGLGVSET